MQSRATANDRRRQTQELRSRMAAMQVQLDAVRRRLQRLRPAPRTARRAQVDASRCTGCGICASACPTGAIRVDRVARVDVGRCTGCGVCVRACPRGALRLLPAGQSDSGEERVRPDA